MADYKYTNTWYPALVIVFVLLVLWANTLTFILKGNLASLIHAAVSLFVLIILITRPSFTGFLIKLWAGITILATFIGFFAYIMMFIVGDKVGMRQLTSTILDLVISVVIIVFWNKSTTPISIDNPKI